MRHAAAIKALKLTVAIGIAISIFAFVAPRVLPFQSYMNPPREIPAWVRFSWIFSRVWWMGGWLILSLFLFFLAMVWINERMGQREKNG
jgi:hypothetical protein